MRDGYKPAEIFNGRGGVFHSAKHPRITYGLQTLKQMVLGWAEDRQLVLQTVAENVRLAATAIEITPFQPLSSSSAVVGCTRSFDIRGLRF